MNGHLKDAYASQCLGLADTNWHSAQESTSYGEKVARTKIPTTPQKSGNE
jgi:hypothetical protein